MADEHKIRIVTGDEALLSSARAAVSPLEGWTLMPPETVEELLADPPELGDLILLDGGHNAPRVYESCRRLTGRTRCRTFVVVDAATLDLAEPIALFCGATGAIKKPLEAAVLRKLLANTGPKAPLAREARVGEARTSGAALPQRLLEELCSDPASGLIDVLIDPETSLFNYEFLSYKLDEEYKRAKRFQYPLACVMLGFDGQAEEAVLGRLAGIFLSASRDTDVLGRFDESTFLFLLPNTGPDGAAVMARRIREAAQREELSDLVGDLLAISVGIATFPHPSIQRRDDLFARTREAYFAAREHGDALVYAE